MGVGFMIPVCAETPDPAPHSLAGGGHLLCGAPREPSPNSAIHPGMNLIRNSLALLILALTAALVGCAGTPSRESTGEYLDNTAITAKVKSALISDPVAKARDIQVESFRGTVQLSGFVATQAERQRAEDIARRVEGVRSVRNDLVVRADLGT